MVIILAKLDSNINYGQRRGTVHTPPVAATHNKCEGDAIVDKAQLYKRTCILYRTTSQRHKGH